ncbi:hypothetical protein Cni_G24484 [Canna indica]|uniref:Uncharacterized protein n=1 Tax=Canna indica TaxID=4628 RepID=A0AAQ3QN83_9LILI|nr:hypothetical protein Cni_G24484 [Canna indica]
MDRRIRSLNAKASPSVSRIDERLHRFLRPGALARLRDSRISSARYPRSVAIHRLSLPPSPSPAAPSDASQIDGIPCFVSRAHGPRIMQRKKLAAAKCIFFAPSNMDLLDLVAAH